MFQKCLTECDDCFEFEDSWQEMVNKYGLEKRHWFDRLYDLRHKWCPALNRDLFSAGIVSTQRVEGTNNAISFKANKTTSLYEFFQIFEQVVSRWRSKEIEDNFKNRMQKPSAIRNTHPLLRKAAELYTLNLFNDFKCEFEESLKSYARCDGSHGEFLFYEVSMHHDFKRCHRVLYYSPIQEFYCDCLSFYETKILCYHILRVMHLNNIFEIPSKYIHQRWRKDAKMGLWIGTTVDAQAESHTSGGKRYVYWNFVCSILLQ